MSARPTTTRVSISLEDARGHLVIDGPLALLRDFVRLMHAEAQPDFDAEGAFRALARKGDAYVEVRGDG